MWNLPVIANHRKTGEIGAMNAIQVDHRGEPIEVLAVEERPAPELGDGEVRVRILASPVNPSDLLYVRGHYLGVQGQLPGALHTARVHLLNSRPSEVRYDLRTMKCERLTAGED
jgi:NADPH:quinone reductase